MVEPPTEVGLQDKQRLFRGHALSYEIGARVLEATCMVTSCSTIVRPMRQSQGDVYSSASTLGNSSH